MIVEIASGKYWNEYGVHIGVYEIERLAHKDGFIDGHKIVEIEALNDRFVAVKTIGWNDPADDDDEDEDDE